MSKTREDVLYKTGFGFQESLNFSIEGPSQSHVNESQNLVTLHQIEQNWPVGELTEIECQDEEDSLYVLLPTLAKLCAEKRWITLISPPNNIDQKMFSLYGIDISRVLLIHPKVINDGVNVMNKALKHGTSGIVIFWSSNTPSRFLAQWRKSVKLGNCTGIWINTSAQQSQSRSIALTLEIKSDSNCITSTKKKYFGSKIKTQEKTLISRQNLSKLLSSTMLSTCKTNIKN